MFQIMMSTRFVIIPWASSRSEKSSQKSNGQTHKGCYNWGSNHTGTSVNGFWTGPEKKNWYIILMIGCKKKHKCFLIELSFFDATV